MSNNKLRAEWFWGDRWVCSSAFLLPIEARGLYREMLTQSWLRGGQLPNDHVAIRRAVGCTEEEWFRCWPLVERYWLISADGHSLVNETQLEVIGEAERRASKQRTYRERQANKPGNGSGNAGGNADGNTRGTPSLSPSPSLNASPLTHTHMEPGVADDAAAHGSRSARVRKGRSATDPDPDPPATPPPLDLEQARNEVRARYGALRAALLERVGEDDPGAWVARDTQRLADVVQIPSDAPAVINCLVYAMQNREPEFIWRDGRVPSFRRLAANLEQCVPPDETLRPIGGANGCGELGPENAVELIIEAATCVGYPGPDPNQVRSAVRARLDQSGNPVHVVEALAALALQFRETICRAENGRVLRLQLRTEYTNALRTQNSRVKSGSNLKASRAGA